MIPKIVLSRLVGEKRSSHLDVSFSIARPTDFCNLVTHEYRGPWERGCEFRRNKKKKPRYTVHSYML